MDNDTFWKEEVGRVLNGELVFSFENNNFKVIVVKNNIYNQETCDTFYSEDTYTIVLEEGLTRKLTPYITFEYLEKELWNKLLLLDLPKDVISDYQKILELRKRRNE